MAWSQWSSGARWEVVIVKGIPVWSAFFLFLLGLIRSSPNTLLICSRHTSYTLGLSWWSVVEEAFDLSWWVVAVTLKAGFAWVAAILRDMSLRS